MNTSSLKSSTRLLTPEDQALLAEAAGDDLPSTLQNLIKLMQPNSPELIPGGPKEVSGAAVGDFVIPCFGEQLLRKGSTGFTYQLIGGEIGWPEYIPGRGGFVCPHDEKPGDARWLKSHESPDGKEGLYRTTNNNRVEETVYGHLLVEGRCVAIYAFRSTALQVGKDMFKRASRKAEGDAVGGYALIKWRMTSRPESGNGNRWQLPDPTVVGRFGEANGPMIVEVRLAAGLRKAFKQGLPWALEPPEPPRLDPVPQASSPRPVITSGRPIIQSVETAPPIDRYDGPGDFSEDVPF